MTEHLIVTQEIYNNSQERREYLQDMLALFCMSIKDID